MSVGVIVRARERVRVLHSGAREHACVCAYVCARACAYGDDRQIPLGLNSLGGVVVQPELLA